MRLFLNSGVYPSYRTLFDIKFGTSSSFKSRQQAYLNDRYCAAHFLKPILENDLSSFFTNGDDETMQKAWAVSKGLGANTSLPDILLAQIEDHRTEVFYNLDPIRYGSEFIKRMPGCVKKSLCWRAAPSPNADFEAYDSILCNFPGILKSYEKQGWRTDYFSPAHDPVMNKFATNENRPISVLFIGGYTRHHRRRSQVLEEVANLHGKHNLRFHLDRSRLVRLAESPIGRLMPLKKHRRPTNIQAASYAPVFGLDLYEAISNAKIVLNGAIDMAGNERGNMRCFEAMGCGALLLSDEGQYPKAMQNGQNMVTYSSPTDAVHQIQQLLADKSRLDVVSKQGFDTMKNIYSKQNQMQNFIKILDRL